MRTHRIPLIFLASLLVAGIVGCEQPVPTLGHNIGSIFPAAPDRYWRYNNDGRTDVMYWIAEGTTSPNGEPLVTFALWIGAESEIVDDYGDDQSDWAVRVYFDDTPQGFYLAGWEANPDGPSVSFGTVWFEAPGVPFALANVSIAQSFSVTAGGADWTTTFVDEEDGPFEFNGQSYTDVWHVNVTSSIGNFPLEGDFWLKAGPGIIQYDAVGYRPTDGQVWTHIHNDVLDNIFGID